MPQKLSRRWRVSIVAIGIAIVILLGIIVTLLVIQHKADLEADYRACVAQGGIYDTTNVDGMSAIAERCYSSIYGD